MGKSARRFTPGCLRRKDGETKQKSAAMAEYEIIIPGESAGSAHLIDATPGAERKEDSSYLREVAHDLIKPFESLSLFETGFTLGKDREISEADLNTHLPREGCRRRSTTTPCPREASHVLACL